MVLGKSATNRFKPQGKFLGLAGKQGKGTRMDPTLLGHRPPGSRNSWALESEPSGKQSGAAKRLRAPASAQKAKAVWAPAAAGRAGPSPSARRGTGEVPDRAGQVTAPPLGGAWRTTGRRRTPGLRAGLLSSSPRRSSSSPTRTRSSWTRCWRSARKTVPDSCSLPRPAGLRATAPETAAPARQWAAARRSGGSGKRRRVS